jgi:ornithine--oxo-acid transaminase
LPNHDSEELIMTAVDLDLARAATPTEEVLRATEAHVAHNYHPLDVVVHEAHGAVVTDLEGRDYLDFLGGYSATNSPPRASSSTGSR